MTADPITVREGRLEDMDAIVRFNLAMAAETEGLRLDRATVERGARAVLDDPAKGRFFLAERRGSVAGQLMVTYEWSDWRDGMFLWIQSVFVDPAQRRKGVFAALFRHVADLAAGPGYCGVRLYVHEGNVAARDTYERLGLVSPGYVVLESPDQLRQGD